METKLVFVLDRMTMFPAVAIRLSADDGPVAQAAGYGEPCVLFGHATGGRPFQHDAFAWCDRTYSAAHQWLQKNFDDIRLYEAVDVEHILGDTRDRRYHVHDCIGCVHLGNWERHDLYFCEQHGSMKTVIARRSSHGADYMSGLPLAELALDREQQHPLAQALLRARERGFV